MVVFVVQRIDRFFCVPLTVALPGRSDQLVFLLDFAPMPFFDLIFRWVESLDFGQNLTIWAIGFSHKILSRQILQNLTA